MDKYLIQLLSRFAWIGKRFNLFPFYYEGALVDLETGDEIATVRVGFKNIDFKWNSLAFRNIQRELEKRQFRVNRVSLFPLCIYVDIYNLEKDTLESTIFIEMKNNNWYTGVVIPTFTPDF